MFNLSSVAQKALKVIERCYTNVIETENFLQLDVNLVKKIFFSSELNITSELEVFTAANDWINFKVNKRKKYAKALLLAVRLPLLSDPALNHLLGYSICNNDECRSLVRSVLLDRKTFHQQGKSVEPRYCSQNLFEIFLSSRKRKLKQVDLSEKFHSKVKLGRSVEESEKIYKAVVVRGEVYVVARKQVSGRKKILMIKKYVAESWKTVAEVGYRKKFGVCSFMNCIYIIGGMRRWDAMCVASVRYDTKLGETGSVRGTKARRFHSACAPFDGKIVTAGGCTLQEGYYAEDGSVEVFDHVINAWSPMPSMTRSHHRHCLVAIKTKLFVVGELERDCEVFDKRSNCFALISSSLRWLSNYAPDFPGAVSFGKKIAVFGRQEKTIAFYDTEKDEWYKESCEKLHSITYKSCVKIPMI